MKEKNLDIKAYLKLNGFAIGDLAKILGVSRPLVNNGLNFMEIAPGEKKRIKQMIKEAKKNEKIIRRKTN